MDTVSTRELRDLASESAAPCASIYLATHVAGEQGQQDPVRLKNLVQQAEQRLADGWLRAPEARQLLQAARNLPADPHFWNARSHGLAVFVSPQRFHAYRLPHRFAEQVIINRRFYVKPLLPLLSGGDRFLILALSQNKVRFFVASRDAIDRVEVPGLPPNMDEALNYEGADRGSQVHSAMQGSLGKHSSFGKQGAVFHGQGGEPDTRKDELAQYFRLIDAALAPLLRDETAPLLLAGVEYLLPIYREVSGYPHLAAQELTGNCDYLSDHEVHQRSWPVVAPLFQRAREEGAARYTKLAGTERTSTDVCEIVAAAHAGRVELLFVDSQALHWGQYNSQTNSVELHTERQPEDEDLLDLAAVQTILCRGVAYSVDREQVPGGGTAAAIFRY